MNAEELCKKMQEEKKADSDEYYEEISSKEYLDKYFGTPYFSVRKFFRLCDEERRKFRRNY
ncbi:MAG: hypothetical protein J6B25_00240 [Clostridia bacterium]|nr:hypothetical protein [Clostridia bacterium]